LEHFQEHKPYVSSVNEAYGYGIASERERERERERGEGYL